MATPIWFYKLMPDGSVDMKLRRTPPPGYSAEPPDIEPPEPTYPDRTIPFEEAEAFAHLYPNIARYI